MRTRVVNDVWPLPAIFILSEVAEGASVASIPRSRDPQQGPLHRRKPVYRGSTCRWPDFLPSDVATPRTTTAPSAGERHMRVSCWRPSFITPLSGVFRGVMERSAFPIKVEAEQKLRFQGGWKQARTLVTGHSRRVPAEKYIRKPHSERCHSNTARCHMKLRMVVVLVDVYGNDRSSFLGCYFFNRTCLKKYNLTAHHKNFCGC